MLGECCVVIDDPRSFEQHKLAVHSRALLAFLCSAERNGILGKFGLAFTGDGVHGLLRE